MNSQQTLITIVVQIPDAIQPQGAIISGKKKLTWFNDTY
jgi:hypothetical protein